MSGNRKYSQEVDEGFAVRWLDRDDREEAQEKPKWTPEPTCSCSHSGEPYLLDGIMVISRDPACRIHVTKLTFATNPVSAETIVGNWKEAEKK